MQKNRTRRLDSERLENRSLMSADIAEGLRLDSNLGVNHGIGDHNEESHSHNYFEDQLGIAEENNETNWILRMDSGTVDEILSLISPAVLGAFSPPTLTFTTLANGMPILNSLLGSPTSVFLDFDGDATTGTDPYDTDGNTAAFNSTEQNVIAEAWRHISTYFAMFDTNVTTIQPPTAQPKVWHASGNNIIGGYSAVNVFPNTQARSFNQSSDARGRQSGIAHEVGHNFGLSHQSDFDKYGVETADYSSGYDQLHVPIMGVDFAQRVRKWYIGHTSNASVLQDDVAIITGKIRPYQAAGGDGFRADDFAGTIATATMLTVDDDVQYRSGIIERLTDVDAFSFTSNGQSIKVAARADFPSGVDLKLEIYDAAGVLLAAKDGPENDQDITITLPTGTYYALVSSHGDYGDLGTYIVSVRSLPVGWLSQDIGTVGITGSSQFESSNNSFVLAGSGADIGGTSDEMQFAWQMLTGDGTITARVNSIINTTGNAKAGLEIRDSVNGNSRHVALTATATQGNKFIRRTTAGGNSTTSSSAAAVFTPVWLRLQRAGNTFTASTSPNGTTWTTLGTADVTLNSTVRIGLVVTAQNDRLYNVATFNNVTVTGNLGSTTPPSNGLPAPTGVNVVRGTGADLTINWNDQASETGYRVERSIDGVVFTTAGTTAANVTTYTDTGLTGTMRYFYRVLALSASGASVPSAIDSELNRPSAVRTLQTTSLDQNRIVLDWIETSGETGYRIERSPDGVTYTTIATVGANIPSYTNSGLTSGESFFYRVTPTSALGDGVSAVVGGETRLPVVAGLVFTQITPTQLQLGWTDLGVETGYTIQRSTNGTTYADIATVPANSTSYIDTTVAAASEYYYRVVGTAGNSISLYNGVFTATPAATALPSNWSARDIGTVSGSGSGMTSFASNAFKVISSGSTIGGTSDSFRFTYQVLDGDGSITANVASLENTNDSARAGVMIREALTTGSRSAFVSGRAANPIQFLTRLITGGSTSTATDITDSAPVWLRLTRVGNVFTAFRSPDGTTWTQIGQSTIAMSSTVFIGLAASATTTTELNTSTFDNVSLTGDIRDAKVVTRQVFYNRSTSPLFGNGSGNPSGAIDPTKVALLPGQTTSQASYTNYTRGINGLIVDVDGAGAVTAADFQFATWNGISAAGFVAATATPTVSLLAGLGFNGTDRVKIEFPDNALRNTWLRVTVLATANTNLFANDVFYFGNAVGEMYVGNIAGPPVLLRTNATDTATVRQNQSPNPDSVNVFSFYDINKDGRVNATDTGLVRQNQSPSGSIQYFTAPINLEIVLPAFEGPSNGELAPAFESLDSNNSTLASESDELSISKAIVGTIESAIPSMNLRFSAPRHPLPLNLNHFESLRFSDESNSQLAVGIPAIDDYFTELGRKTRRFGIRN